MGNIRRLGRRRSLASGSQPRSRGHAGLSIAELMIGLTVLVIGVVGALTSVTSSAMLGETSPETTRAHLAVIQTIETLRAESFSDVFARYNSTPADDPGAPGTGPGPGFAVAGLDPQRGDADGMVGEIILPEDELDPRVLREDKDDADFGLPRDLDADGVIDADDHAGDYLQLPVRVRISWRGSAGNRTLESETILGRW